MSISSNSTCSSMAIADDQMNDSLLFQEQIEPSHNYYGHSIIISSTTSKMLQRDHSFDKSETKVHPECNNDNYKKFPMLEQCSPFLPLTSSVYFSSVNRMSLFSLEKRIDYHLSRIMKGHRLINFKNSIERLPAEKRICECIIEILMSSSNLITRKTRIIIESKRMVDEFFRTKFLNSEEGREEYLERLEAIRSMAINLEQIVWALNSNKEHIKYIVKVFAAPELYQRSEFLNDPNSVIPLKQNIIQCIEQCKQAIAVCRIIRQQIQNAVINSYMTYFNN